MGNFTTLRNRLFLQPAEQFMITVSLAAAITGGVLILLKQPVIDYPAYGVTLAVVALLMALGLFYRASGRSERIASAAVCAGAFIFFTVCLSVFNYLLMPITRPLIDPLLIRVDASLGFHWPDAMAWAAQNPFASDILKYAYMSTMPQLTLLVVVLGMTARFRDLHVLITSVAITATLTICFWGVFPSIGTSAFYTLPPEIWSGSNPLVDAGYGHYLMETVTHGPAIITPAEVRGMIAFPSYHAVLAFTAMYAARNVPVLSIVFLVLNLLILPSVIVHGGHHLVDIAGGGAMTVLGLYLAGKFIRKDVPVKIRGGTVSA